MFDANNMSPLEVVLTITELILCVIFVVLGLRYGREYDRYLKRMYPDIVEQIRRNQPFWMLAGINPLFSISIIEGIAVRDEKLRVFRRKAICSFICAMGVLMVPYFLKAALCLVFA